MNFAEIFASVPSLIKGIDQLVTTFEQPGNGAAKKQAVVNTLGTAYDVASASGVPLIFTKYEALTFADAAINDIVNFKNVVGGFEKTVVADVKQAEHSIVNDAKQLVGDVKAGVEQVVSDVKAEVQGLTHPQQ